MLVDASAAKCASEKTGVGVMTHIALRHLFLKEIVKQKLIYVRKINTKLNILDLMTKSVDKATLIRLMGRIGLVNDYDDVVQKESSGVYSC